MGLWITQLARLYPGKDQNKLVRWKTISLEDDIADFFQSMSDLLLCTEGASLQKLNRGSDIIDFIASDWKTFNAVALHELRTELLFTRWDYKC